MRKAALHNLIPNSLPTFIRSLLFITMSDYVSIAEQHEDKWLNFQLICKPEQSGKTFIMISKIIQLITENTTPQDKEIVHFILCDNNLLLTKQTGNRVRKDVSEYCENGVSYIELSSSKRTKYHDNPSVFHAIVADGVRNIICCTNGKRLDDIYSLITDLNKTRFTRDNFQFYIWLDEGDKFTRFIDTTLIPLVDKYDNVLVKLLTSTPEPLFKKYTYMNVLPLENTTSEDYHGWADNNIREFEMPSNNYALFAEYILSEIAPDKIQPNTRWFIPATTTKKSHETIKDICVAKGMAVMRVNGDGILLTLPNHEHKVYSKTEEFTVQLIQIYEEMELSRFPFAITGNICIGRGITMLSKDFLFNYGIMSHYSNKNEASQLAGRMKGNIKGFVQYNDETNPAPTIYTTVDFNKAVSEWERRSRTLAVLSHEREASGQSTVIHKSDFTTLAAPFDYVCHPELFRTFALAKNFLMTKEREMRGKVKGTAKKSVIHECNGYFVTSKLLAAGRTVDDLTEADRITLADAANISHSRCISSTDGGSRYLILPVYESMASRGKDVRFQVRYLRFKE